ncbi:diaminopimelate epimerase [Hanamia caeni]|jgi:diaminopimelate epimerase|uniref:Diaminopimelate epimerase n=1 Tax=Hanamia caeni TaxID=2294116 RepID=A0A3M9NAB0_9BACT|nr:diaminopimelate epimerase [Hanamia caeni]RNI34193.1 diaminopimelate epimerase [Hanamia caeni]
MKIKFYKYQGSGNDFIIIDNREKAGDKLTTKQINKMCDRHFGIGADGLMLLNEKEGFDFEMVYFNADGNLGSMCGNGGRCIVQFASNMGIKKNEYIFSASDGTHKAKVDLDKQVSLEMKDVPGVEFSLDHYVLNTGSPHYVKFVTGLEDLDVVSEGRKIRNNKAFVTEGINVNFVETIDDDHIFVRTYERGVEDETLSCGTGVTASALIAAHNENGFNRVEVKSKGGNLSVEFDKISDTKFTNIWLSGPATFVFSGEYEIKAY